jgi:hypothetical protein
MPFVLGVFAQGDELVRRSMEALERGLRTVFMMSSCPCIWAGTYEVEFLELREDRGERSANDHSGGHPLHDERCRIGQDHPLLPFFK